MAHTPELTPFRQVLTEKILEFPFDPTGPITHFTPEIADAIHQVWKDLVIPTIMDEHSSEFYLMDSAP